MHVTVTLSFMHQFGYRRFSSPLPRWEVIPEPPASSEASSDDEPQSVSQTQPISSLGGGDNGSKRRFSGQRDSSPKSKKQRMGQLGSGNDSIPARVPSLTQPAALSSLTSVSTDPPSNDPPKRIQMRKPTGGNYQKRLAMPSSSTPSSSKLTNETSIFTKERISKQTSHLSPTSGDRRTREDESDVILRSSTSTAVPPGGGKGKGKAKETPYKPEEQRPRSQLSFKHEGKTRGDSESSREDDQDIIGRRFGQLQRENGKARTEKWSGGSKKPEFTFRDKGSRDDGRFSGSRMAIEVLTTKPMKRSKAERERRKSLGDTLSISSDAESGRGNGKAARMLSSVSEKHRNARVHSNDLIELSSSEDIKKPEVIEISDSDTTPPPTQQKIKTSPKKRELSAIIDLTIDDGWEDGGDSALTAAPAAQCVSSTSEHPTPTHRKTATNEEVKLDFADAPDRDLNMTTCEGSRMNVVSDYVDDCDSINNVESGPAPSTSMHDAMTGFSSATAYLKDTVVGSGTSSANKSCSVSRTNSPLVKQQSLPPSSPKKEPPYSPQKKSSPNPKLEPCEGSSHPSLLPSTFLLGERSPSHVPPSSEPAERQEQETLPSQLESSPTILDFDPNTKVLPPPLSTSSTGDSKPLSEPFITDSVNIPARSSSDLLPAGTEMMTVEGHSAESSSTEQQRDSSIKRKHNSEREEQHGKQGKTSEPSRSPRADPYANKTGVRSRDKIFTARKSTGSAAPRLPRQIRRSSPPSSPPSTDAYISSLTQALHDAGRANALDLQEQPRGQKKQDQRSRNTFSIEQLKSAEPEPEPMALNSPMMNFTTEARLMRNKDVHVAVISSSLSTSSTVPTPSTSSSTGLISSTLPPIIASVDKIAQAKARWHALPSGLPNGNVEESLASTFINNDDRRISFAAPSQEGQSLPNIDMHTPRDSPSKSTLPEQQEVIDLTTLLESSDDDDEAGTMIGRNLLLALDPRPRGSPDSQASSKLLTPSEQLSSELANALKMDGPQVTPAVEEEEEWLEYLDEKVLEPSNDVSRSGESPTLVYPEGSDHGMEPTTDGDVVERNRSPPTPAPSTNVPEVPVLEEELGGRASRSRSPSSSTGPVVLRRSARNSRPPSQMSLMSTNTDILNLSGVKEKEQLSFGGLTVLTWKSFRSNLNNFRPKCHWSVDLPHAFHDHINWLSEDHRNNDQMRHILESIMIENTSEEPHAPPISIVNRFGSMPTPPWEFYYTNKMWHSSGVPAPSVKRLGSCGCIGKCHPDTCACAKRQKKYTETYVSAGFVYDKHKCLLQGGIPIFECNSLCGCDDDCMNRVVQHGRKVDISLFKTPNKGWGVVNGTRKIPQGQFIGVYSGEYLTWDEAESRGKVYNKFGRTYLFDCDLYFFNGDPRYTIDAYHAGNFTRFLNHSCDPNAHFGYVYIDEDNIYKPLLCVFARRDIPPGEEITFSYRGDDPVAGEDDAKSKGSRSKKVNSDTVYSECFCGAKNCTGILFN